MLTKLIARFGRKVAPRSHPSSRPCLEELESRLTPTPVSTGTYTNAIVQVSPSFFSGTVTETITATVTNAPIFNPFTGTTTPVPSGATTPSGTILFNLNNKMQSAQLNSNGQATVSFTLPFFTVFTSQALEVSYLGNFTNPDVESQGSTFLAPLYMNYNNLLFPAALTFGQLTPQQVQPIVNANGNQTGLASFNTAQGETDSFGIVSFQYVDPGIINQIQAFGFNLPGSFAAQLNAFGPQFSGQSNGG
jgi:hypothetical protein